MQGDDGGFSLYLSVFVLFSGGGSGDDFAMMTVNHTGTGILWEVPASESALFSADSSHFWAGSSLLSPIPSILKEDFDNADEASFIWGLEGFFPKGEYTVTADNAAGESAAASFSLDAPFYFAESPAAFRLLGAGEDSLWQVELSENVDPSEVSAYLLLIDEEGAPISSIRIAYELFAGRIAEGSVSSLTQVESSRREEPPPPPAAISCYVEHSPSASAVLLFPLSLGYDGAR